MADAGHSITGACFPQGPFSRQPRLVGLREGRAEPVSVQVLAQLVLHCAHWPLRPQFRLIQVAPTQGSIGVRAIAFGVDSESQESRFSECVEIATRTPGRSGTCAWMRMSP